MDGSARYDEDPDEHRGRLHLLQMRHGLALERAAAALERIAETLEETASCAGHIASAVNDFEHDDTITKAIERLRAQVQMHTFEILTP